MKYDNICPGIFLSRPNRFTAEIEINGQRERCHVKNTGRLRELLIPGSEVYVQKSNGVHRKTAYDLISVRRGEKLFNIDSYAPNLVFGEFLKSGGLGFECEKILPEQKYLDSRFDFYFEHSHVPSFAEVKGVTLEENGILRFPDAPTLRGLKHVKGLMNAAENGYDTYCIFILQTCGASAFEPNRAAQNEFAEALKAAAAQGVRILAFDCAVTQDEIKVSQPVKVRL